MRQDFLGISEQHNRETAALTDAFASHRGQVMTLIDASATDLLGHREGRCAAIALLGAGNCLDVDLNELAKRFDRIHLVDVDQTAVQAAVNSSRVAEQLRVHAPVDVAAPLMSLTSRDFRPDEDNRERCAELLQKLSGDCFTSELPAVDIVASLCVFSQIIHTAGRLLNTDHPAFPNLLKALRIGHLRRILKLLKPGGIAILVCDVVSSETAPQLNSTAPNDLAELIRQLVGDGNFFSGTNPAMMLADLNLLTRLPHGPETVHTIDPWLWNLGNRTYAVYALRIQKTRPES
ncbi:MAG: hypothetical protein R3C49_06040 [Planctomycetaceae bacterium]